MTSVRSAPGFMNIYELIYMVGKGLSNPVISRIDKAEFGEEITDDYMIQPVAYFKRFGVWIFGFSKNSIAFQFFTLNIF